ncbi:MAG: type 4a pilus biogenesis protein PilO [Deltaproteobacteria bacterium]
MNLAFLARLNPKEKTVAAVAAVIVGLALVDRLLIAPVAYRLRLLDERIEAQTELIRKNVRIVAEKDRVKAAADAFKVYYANTAATQEEETGLLLGEVEEMARRSALYVVDMKPLAGEEDAVSRKVSVDLNCEAQMEQILTFMHTVASAGRLLFVESVNLTPKSKDSSIVKCNMKISNIIFL